MYQILEVGDEWKILKCTLHWRRVQKISIILANLGEFLVISIFHETKIPMVDIKIHVYSKFRKKNLGKKWNLQVPWEMEDLTLPNVGVSFKKWGTLHPPPILRSPCPCYNTRAFKKIK
jgi:hypothetical protein